MGPVGLVGLLAACGPAPETPTRAAPDNAAPQVAEPALEGAGPQRLLDVRVARLATEVARLQQEVDALRAARQEPSSDAAADAPGRHARLRAPQDRQARALAQAARADATESAFRGETVETGWSRQTAEAVRGAFLQSNAGQEPRSVECRSRTCRLELAPAEDGNPDALIPLLTRLAPVLPHASTVRIDGGDGRPTTVVYLTR
jgi:hypothetical protein